mgnify:CR=1 FL=1
MKIKVLRRQDILNEYLPQYLSGAPVIDRDENFVGIIEYSEKLKIPSVLTKGVVVGWLCELG